MNRSSNDGFYDPNYLPSLFQLFSVIVMVLCGGYGFGLFHFMTPLYNAGLIFTLGLWSFVKVYTAYKLDARMQKENPGHGYEPTIDRLKMWSIAIFTFVLIVFPFPRTMGGIIACLILLIYMIAIWIGIDERKEREKCETKSAQLTLK